METLGEIDTIFHAATPTYYHDKTMMNLPALTSSVLEKCKLLDQPRFIHLSSGGVYKRPQFLGRLIPEGTDRVSADQAVNAYQQVKVTLEDLVEEATRAGIIRGVNPRLFSFAGPGFPLDSNFAFADFMRAGLSGRPIEIKGNPFTNRSYMHPVNMVEWILTTWLNADLIGLMPVHIGSPIPISMLDLATKLANSLGGMEVIYSEVTQQPADWYVPDVLSLRNFGCSVDNYNIEKIIESWRSYLSPQRSLWS
jgi:nucleoside-diphosphate-sugar epimerase